ncbi:AAA family ATPase [Verrucomicrobiales bacterium BCK34]|nr:AAA family ATPase [Verrucomicrobiales bacterium BCK34]
MTMSSDENPQFSHGAEWVRADFHLHTIQEPGASRKAYRAEFRDSDRDFDSEFIARLVDEEIRVGVITNHNAFDKAEYNRLAKKAENESILLLPGLELGIKGGNSTIHTLVVFDPVGLDGKRNCIQEILLQQFPQGNPDEGDATQDEFCTVLQKLEALNVDYFIVFAHVCSDNGLLNDLTKTNLEPDYKKCRDTWDQRVLGFQKVKNGGDWVKQKLPAGMPIPAFVEGSDPRDSIQQVGRKENGVCFLKLSELSFASVKFALRDHPLRVAAELPEGDPHAVIETLEIEGGPLGFSACKFSPELNTLIGSRGSGKSLIIESLRWGLGIESGESDKKYKADLIHNFLDRGAVVRICGRNEHGDEIVVERAYTEKTNPAPPTVTVNGEATSISPLRVFSGLLYFGQKDLGERQEGFYDQLFTQVLGSYSPELDDAEAMAKKAFQKSIADYETALNAKSNDDELKFEEEGLTKQLAAFQEHGVEDHLKRITEFDQDLRRFTRFQERAIEFGEELESTSIVQGEELLDGAILKSDSTKELHDDAEALRGEFTAIYQSIRKRNEELEAIEDKLSTFQKTLELKRQELQAEFAQILQEVDIEDLDIDAYRKMVSRREQIAEIRRLTAEQGGKLQEFEKALLGAGEKWIAAKEEINKVLTGKIESVNSSLPSELRLGLKFQGDEADFRGFLEGLFRGTRFNEGSYERLLGCSNGLEIFKRRTQLTETELSPQMAEKLKTVLFENLETFLLYSPRDLKTVSYGDTSLTELSLGKRAMALLLLLLSLDNHPIIILDQPEDDLDNETVHRLLVGPLLERKESIQFIVATHNPNIPVLGDAEQVFACYERKRRDLDRKTGSLDHSGTKKAIIKIMEGGKKAFNKRSDIYDVWKRSN